MPELYAFFNGRLSIFTVPLVIRLGVSVPTTVYQQQVMGRLELLQPHLQEWTEALKHHVVRCTYELPCRALELNPTHVHYRRPSQSERTRLMTSTKLISPSR